MEKVSKTGLSAISLPDPTALTLREKRGGYKAVAMNEIVN
jgi:hypothetical protein